MDSDGYSTISETLRSRCRNRKKRGEKQLAPVHLDMPIFKSTDPNADVTYTLWRFDVQGGLDQYQEESMMPYIYNSLRGYPGRWVCSLDGGQNLTVTELLEWMDCAFGDVQEYATMICSLYKIKQKKGESVEEYMLQIHEAVVVIHHTYPDWVANQGKNCMWARFYYGLGPSLMDALEFAMVELPEREQAGASFDTLYTLAKKMEACQPNHTHWGQGSSDAYQDRYRRYPAPGGRVATLTEEELLLPDPEPLDLGVPELDVIEGLSLRMTQAMNHYQREECQCFMCGTTNHFAQDCPHRDSFCLWQKEQLNSQGGGLQPKEPIKPSMDVSAHMVMMCDAPLMIASGPTAY